FAAQLFRRRVTLVLLLLVYTFSGIGLWNSSWFYFQESATLFFLLGSALLLLRRPTPPRLLLFLAAVLVQGTSLNYWSVYNAWFRLLFVGSHACLYRDRWRRLIGRLAGWVAANRRLSAGIAALVLLVGGLSVALIGSVAAEQNRNYVRTGRGDYTMEQAF